MIGDEEKLIHGGEVAIARRIAQAVSERIDEIERDRHPLADRPAEVGTYLGGLFAKEILRHGRAVRDEVCRLLLDEDKGMRQQAARNN